jgi:hypothetical protein
VIVELGSYSALGGMDGWMGGSLRKTHRETDRQTRRKVAVDPGDGQAWPDGVGVALFSIRFNPVTSIATQRLRSDRVGSIHWCFQRRH